MDPFSARTVRKLKLINLLIQSVVDYYLIIDFLKFDNFFLDPYIFENIDIV